eukprot:m.836030 g.836030  ORF g.836030 m.836030 type:complete len:140 (-) comp59479_c0_seq36:435-854(-)
MGKTFIGSCLLASLSQDMPWLAFASNDLKSASDLMQHFNVDGIPRVILLDPELKLISKEARRTIMTDRDGQYFPWRPEPIMPLDDAALTFIDNFPFMLVRILAMFVAAFASSISARYPSFADESVMTHFIAVRLVLDRP